MAASRDSCASIAAWRRRIGTKQQAAEEGETELTVPRQELDAQIAERIGRGAELLERTIDSVEALATARADFYTWHDFNKTLLRRSFTTSRPADDYATWGAFAFSGRSTLWEATEDLREDIRKKLRRLESLREQLVLYASDRSLGTMEVGNKVVGTDVFIVHGHTGWIVEAAARFVAEVTTSTPIILREQPNQGRTIIEKFEDYAPQAGFAIVLLTADDVGRATADTEDRARPRQNVVFELGFFIGALGRNKVAVLYQTGVELPSDMSGVLYTELDPGEAWKLALAREMKAVGLEVDVNRAI